MGSGVTVLVALYSLWPMSEVTLLHAYQSSPTVLEGTVFATVPLPLRACLVKSGGYSCVKLPASGEVGVIWLRFRSALAVKLHLLVTPHTSGSLRCQSAAYD